ncbi:MAG: methylmalonyl-CoA carboxyltransferase [Candidatus Syntrophonatronum acetioxidans]|uniref:Methylmalonyl-CoA carboxyltransferase n=1 Tax=Candidatus Syntrophonatronum acetioxidans TaxID=1795816 RepID=A0A424YDG1_9FIRM|nr:MAG: methylmalonyl-CoA carboxyltransferase [Candidatus Syntrophonatronum acetioxidans]
MDVESKMNYFKQEKSKGKGNNEGNPRKRIENIFDDESFMEYYAFKREEDGRGNEIIAGSGTISQRPVYIMVQDSSVNGGIISDKGGQKILSLLEQAGKTGAPLISIFDGQGVQVENSWDTLELFGKLFSAYATYSGVIPLLTLVAGYCPGALSFAVPLSDFVFGIKDNSFVYLNTPQAIKDVTGKDITFEELGGAQINAQQNGNIHFLAENEEEACKHLRDLVEFLPLNNLEKPPIKESADDINRVSPGIVDLLKEDYDVREIIKELADEKAFLEIQEEFAPNLVTGFIRLNGYSLGVLANQPFVLKGSLDLNSSEKGASFIRFCDAFNIPLLTLVDIPGYLSTIYQEQSGITKKGAKLIFAYAEASVPKISLITGKCYGVAGISMGSKYLKVDQVLAWPTAQIGALSPAGLSSLFSLPEAETEKAVSPYEAVIQGLVDDIIEPEESRPHLAYTLEFLKTGRKLAPGKKHGNFPV